MVDWRQLCILFGAAGAPTYFSAAFQPINFVVLPTWWLLLSAFPFIYLFTSPFLLLPLSDSAAAIFVFVSINQWLQLTGEAGITNHTMVVPVDGRLQTMRLVDQLWLVSGSCRLVCRLAGKIPPSCLPVCGHVCMGSKWRYR